MLETKKVCKSYTCKISGNKTKIQYLESMLQTLTKLSKYVFGLGQQSWSNQKTLYKDCRNKFPKLNSKVLQNFISLYQKVGKKKLPKVPKKAAIYIDQSFNIKFDSNTKLTNYWIKFHRKRFPLLGKRNLSRVKLESVKLIQIFKRKNKLYCKLMTSETIPVSNMKTKCIGLDVNTKRLVLSNGSFFHTKDLFHRKMERKKNKWKKHATFNYTKDYIHKLTTKMVSTLLTKGKEVLVLEDLKHLRKSACKKNGTSKGKHLNYILNSFPYSMFQSFLEYKCLNSGINVVRVDPAWTSKTCSSCGSTNTSRPKQQSFICLDCSFKLDADLNGSRNIRNRYTQSEWANSESSPPGDLKDSGKLVASAIQ